MAKIHATAIIEESVTLEDDVNIGAYCVISGNVTIGNGTVIHNYVSIQGNTKIGKNCEIFPFASLGSKPQDYKFKNEKTFLEIGDGNLIREYVTMNIGTEFGGGITKVGNNNMFMMSAHVGHDCQVGSNCTIANNVALGGHVVIDDFVVIGGNSAVHQFVRIGSNVMIGGMVGVKENIIPFALVTPSDSSVYGAIRGVNIVGLKRKGFEKSDISQIIKAYDILSSDKSIEEKIKNLKEMGKYAESIVNFIHQSQNMGHSKGLASFVK
jgi:UDP-N-acetylglucosamine acyltransferase